jgi:carbamoyl-phosphate synthase small subunit
LNLNDNTLEGIRLLDKKAFSVQFHPEAAAGPHDSRYLFDEFINMMKGQAIFQEKKQIIEIF